MRQFLASVTWLCTQSVWATVTIRMWHFPISSSLGDLKLDKVSERRAAQIYATAIVGDENVTAKITVIMPGNDWRFKGSLTGKQWEILSFHGNRTTCQAHKLTHRLRKTACARVLCSLAHELLNLAGCHMGLTFHYWRQQMPACTPTGGCRFEQTSVTYPEHILPETSATSEEAAPSLSSPVSPS